MNNNKLIWIKQSSKFMYQPITKKLRRLKNGADCVIIFLKLQSLFAESEDFKINYNDCDESFATQLSDLIDEDIENIQTVLDLLIKQGVIKPEKNNIFTWVDFQDTKIVKENARTEYFREYMRNYRAQKRTQGSGKTVNTVFTSVNSKQFVNSSLTGKKVVQPTKTPDTSEVQGFEQTVIPEVASISHARVKDLKDLKDLDLKNLKPKDIKSKTLKPKNLCARKRTRVDKTPTRDINLLEISKNVIGRLNKVAGTTFRHTTPSTLKNIKQILNADYTQDNFFTVIDKMGYLWTVVSPEMHGYLRPSTLFGSASKFDEYLNLVPGRKLTKSQKVALESMQNFAEIARVTDALEKSGLKFAPDNSEHRPNDLSDFEDFFKNSFNQESGIAC